ncbi:YxlC family protein [Neobacillus sp. MM2021_6]|uniref:YxlC family protein n=1 Tax=Bacillaceae TaxID=186817 RepID=UPI00140CB054|nr:MULTISPECIES: YxlC family protein [Bacillaceae]MBO0961306.1 YxlC family protein [Neobacillus sp. MM2021_6]NHC18802.1 YxlC family protein [Bacillus sp. MM2020_4]
MKKQKVIKLNSEQQNKQDIDTIAELQGGLQKVDQFPVYTPNLQWFEQFVIQEQQNKKKRFIRDLSIFSIIALIILSGIIISLYQMPVIFISVQIITIVFIVVYTSVQLVKKANHI